MAYPESWGIRQLSNWGRWGKDDQLGTANFITRNVIAAAAREAREGKVFSLAIPFDRGGPVHPARTPYQHYFAMVNAGGDAWGLGLKSSMVWNEDIVTMPLQIATQWDGLAHAGYDGMFYNGVPINRVTAHGGAARNSISALSQTLITRGVLLDLVSHQKAELGHLAPGYAISCADIDSCLAAQKVTPQSGDALLVRTGWVPHWFKHPGQREDYWKSAPGLSYKTVEWIHDHEISCVAVDNIAAEVTPSELRDEPTPFHRIAIRDLGLTIGEVFNFEALAEDCRGNGRYTCFFVGPPLPFVGGVGSPINPVAMK
ncbi:MAG TPA: cyclase family protein [Candidatus Binataceae bacterium]|nr:cyclase family protein [Candidatus Binataceae bacterium]